VLITNIGTLLKFGAETRAPSANSYTQRHAGLVTCMQSVRHNSGKLACIRCMLGLGENIDVSGNPTYINYTVIPALKISGILCRKIFFVEFQSLNAVDNNNT
jgi:hypothetical protein